ncbi:siderophore-interacting protein [Paraburkholderia phosphatilytica]|uniref:siderophore-interacting protein n=1 Tax=Paraburkholderia phosphatilytica TaxID=2282883 RepID=UPI000E4B86B4|nr:siderophore-interacting protein [Paraburkholderia phosphatilytica]
MQNRPDLAVERVRHPLKFRLLQVTRVNRVTPSLVRVTLTGDDLDDFVSASFDDHVKVFFPAPGASVPVLPSLGPDGIAFPDGVPRPAARDYTPRRYNRAEGELDIEFTLHDAGPASAWAAQAQAGQYLGLGGPRGSLVIPAGFDWHLLIGDETALPAIARRIEELPAGARVAAVIEVESPSHEIKFDTDADLFVVWVHRSSAAADDANESALLQAVRDTYLPPGDGYVWAAGESSAIRAIRQYLCDERGVDKKRIRAASYWRRGTQAVHESFDD